ncbi:FecCD family ABC transporter permease [Streptomyces sp. NPDC059639]|uniref:FecCD family ABC transporter permease n=1 Tax=Streptomyces sp. NPDC059639 TaxID=3346891 RepID=UPI0036C17CF8
MSRTAAPSAPTAVPRGRIPTAPLAVGLALVLAGSLVCGVGLGATGLGWGQVLRLMWAGLSGGSLGSGDAGMYTIVWEIRFPRVVLAAVVGAGLAGVGVAVQALVRNALADPFVLGISSGAAVGANAVILFGALAGFGVWALSVSAFLSALAATLVVYVVARSPLGLSPLRLVLTGTALAYGFQAVTTVMVFGAERGEAARAAMMWLLGSLGGATWPKVPLAAATVVAGWLWLRARAGSLDALSMGDETSAALGVPPDRLRRELFVVTAAVTGTVVAVSGAIGFVGLMVPHLVRMLVGASHARVLVVAPLAGAILLVWADVLSRVLLAPTELPVGVVTAALGVPAFLLLMRRGGHALSGR